jgi:soluble lytic murein transglycosylase-like protein
MRTQVIPALVMFGSLCPLQGAAGAADNPATDFAGQRAESIRLMRQSIARQRESARNQASRAQRIADSEPKPLLTAPAVAACDPIPDAESAPMIAEAASESRLDPELLRAVIHQESAFRPCAVSGRGAMGLMQLMPDTAASLRVTDPFDPRQNLRSGAQYLRQMLDQFKGDEELALAAYNAGPARVQDGSFFDIPEVQRYIERILEEWKGTRKQPDIAKDRP